MNADLLRKAAEKIGNPNILVNLVSKRVRQLNNAGTRPLLQEAAGLGLGDIALAELVEGTMDWERIEPLPAETHPKRRRRS